MEKLFDGEYRLMEVLWESAPVNSTQLVTLCREQLGWTKSTTYTVLRKLCRKGAARNERAVVTPLLTREQVIRAQGEELAVKAGGDGPLPQRLFQRAEADHGGGTGAEGPDRPAHLGGLTVDGLNTWLTIFLNHLNAGLALGVVLAVLILLRPLLLRLLTPQQWVAVWYVAWSIGIFGNLWGLTSLVRVLPVTVWDLLGPRPGGIFGAPAFLPPAYDGPGEYPVVLPGGETAAVELNSGPLLALSLLWAAVAVGLLLWYCHRSFALMCWGRQGSELEEKELVALGADRLELWMQPGKIRAWITPGLPTSFVMGDSVYLQAELPKEQLSLVLRHELNHIYLRHGYFSGLRGACLLLHWWNPILWLAFRYMGRDMELACDQRTLDQLEPEERKEYAKTLVELGAGRRLWEAPLCFGECDGALRVRAAVAWRPLTPVRRLTGLFCAALVFLLFAGAPAVPGGVTETDLSRNLTQMEEAPEKVVEELIRRLEEKGDLLSGVSIAAGWWKWEGTGGRIYLETSVGTWRAFRCVLGESGKMGMIQLRQEGRPHDLADCTQFYPVD